MPPGWPVSRPPLSRENPPPTSISRQERLSFSAVSVTTTFVLSERLPANASDEAIVSLAKQEGRVVLTQDLDFSVLIATAGESRPSVVTLRLASPRVERVNEVLCAALPKLAAAVAEGAIVTVEDTRIRVRQLPIR
jgi:predicted nuclease of predicted toxin-antitoxin system